MKNTATVFTMQGMGDHISYNALVRRLLIQKKVDEIYVFCWSHYAPSVAFMYRDDPRIKIVPITSGREYEESRPLIPHLNSKYVYLLGHNITPDRPMHDVVNPNAEYYQVSWRNLADTFQWGHRNYYEYCMVDWKYRFTECEFARAMKEEARVFDKLNPNHEEYIFMQDDATRGHHMRMDLVKELVGKDIKIITNDPSEPIFFYPMILQNAKQIHLMESSFRCLIETIPTEGVDFYFHHYIRKTERLVYDGKICPVETRKPWIVIE
jgi:hypothetical protein